MVVVMQTSLKTKLPTAACILQYSSASTEKKLAATLLMLVLTLHVDRYGTWSALLASDCILKIVSGLLPA